MAAVEDPVSLVFRRFEKLTNITTGRTVGRKIGVAQELILKKYLAADEQLRRRMYLERRLTGASGAQHKVEFSWYAIEPHAVGLGDAVTGLTVKALDEEKQAVRLTKPGGGTLTVRARPLGAQATNVRSVLGPDKDLRVVRVDAETAQIDVVDFDRLLGALESKRVGAQRFAASEKIGAGIQTIEKAKQASLVAVDLDLRHNPVIKHLRTDEPRPLISVVAVGNGVNWTPKDKSVFATFVDFTFLVQDSVVLRYIDYVAETDHGLPDDLAAFMAYFNGLTTQPDDDFEVADDDFLMLVPQPQADSRTLREILVEHVLAENG